MNRTLGVVVAGVFVWWLIGHMRSEAEASDPDRDPAAAAVKAAHERAAVPGFGDQVARARRARVPFITPTPISGEVEISGRVFEVTENTPIGDAEVVLLSAAGEASAITDGTGRYTISVPRGMYRAYVRGDLVMSVGRDGVVRIPDAPAEDAVGAPVEAAMAVVLATADTDHVDLPVMQYGVIDGRVVDDRGAPIAGAVVQSTDLSSMRPVLGTDVAESGRDGSFELRVPKGAVTLSASHSRFAGVREKALRIEPASHTSVVLQLEAGCIVSGRVVRADGSPAGDGAIERKWGDEAEQFSPAAKIAADGTFRWVGLDPAPVELRAWPWKSPPSPSQEFACRDGARFANVVLRLPDEAPALSGTLLEANGEPAKLTYLELQPIDTTAQPQQERADASGQFAFYHLPPGNYLVTAVSDGGMVSEQVRVPQAGVKLTLSGTGRVHGTVKARDDGAMQVSLLGCDGDPYASTTTRLVTVHGGTFELDHVPACRLKLQLQLGVPFNVTTVVPRDGVVELEIDAELNVVRGSDDPNNGAAIEGEVEVEGDGDEAPIADPEDLPGSHTIKEPIREPLIREPLRVQ